jgi:hypothetical protein
MPTRSTKLPETLISAAPGPQAPTCAKHGKDKLGKIRGRIDNRLGNRTQARAGALHVAGDHQKIGRIAREAINGRSDDNIAGREGG